jgi:hypothetical protein
LLEKLILRRFQISINRARETRKTEESVFVRQSHHPRAATTALIRASKKDQMMATPFWKGIAAKRMSLGMIGAANKVMMNMKKGPTSKKRLGGSGK